MNSLHAPLAFDAADSAADSAPPAPGLAPDPAARIGRYTHAELQAMQGRRGRKPPEYFQLFPERRSAPATVADQSPHAAPASAPPRQRRSRAADALAERIRAASPAVQRIIGALLDLPLAATAAVDAPGAVAIDAIAPASVAVLPPSAAQPQSASTTPRLRDPVYADPEAEPVDHEAGLAHASVVG